jgi:hypothetical protein
MCPLTLDDRAVVLTDRGRDFLETHSEPRPDRNLRCVRGEWGGSDKGHSVDMR